MRRLIRETLTWAPAAGAVASAFWLATVDPGWPEWPRLHSMPSLFGDPGTPAQQTQHRGPPVRGGLGRMQR